MNRLTSVGVLLMAGSTLAFVYTIVAPQVSQAVVLDDGSLTEWIADTPHDATQAELIMFAELPEGAPAPPGFTEVNYHRTKVIDTEIYDQSSGDKLYTVHIKTRIAKIESVEIRLDSTLVHSASRSGGGGSFVDRGAYTYVTIDVFVPPAAYTQAEAVWKDGAGVVQGALNLQ